MSHRINKNLIWQNFSLVELIVVTAILAVLFSLLQPVLSGVLSRTRLVACGANLGTIANAGSLHINDYSDHLPLGGSIPNFPEARRGNDIYGMQIEGRLLHFVSAFSYYINSDMNFSSNAEHRNDLKNINNLRLFQCPAKDTQQLSTLIGGGEQNVISKAWSHYGTNTGVVGIEGPRSIKANGDINKVSYPDKTMHIADLQGAGGTEGWTCLTGYRTLEALYYRRGNQKNRYDWERHEFEMNILFVDGHMAPTSIAEAGQVYLGKGIID
ncbi:MAG: hypothetical protein HQL32_01300 [Planctomycetes bacterium]|nr:hypothetical protein [Planctomycetota bacterium]